MIQHSSDIEPPQSRPGLRAVVVGLGFVVLLCWAVPWVDIYFQLSELAGSHFPIGPFLVLLFLAGAVNLVLPKVARRFALSRAELTTVYCMTLAAAGIPTYGLVAYLLPAVTAPFYYGDKTNQWAELVGAQIPERLRPTDPDAIRHFYESSRGGGVPWGDWIGPLCHWTVFVLAIYGLMFCLTALIRKQWVEKERLTFPLVELPLEMVRTEPDTSPFFRNRAVWIGAAIAFAVHGVNGLNTYFPDFPAVTLRTDMSFGDSAWPLNDRLFFHFSVMGFGYLLTSDVSFSIWVFFWFNKVQHYIANQYGAFGPYLELREPQYIGAFIVFVFFILWRERMHFLEVFRKAVHNDPAVDDSREPLSYRAALVGAGVSILVLLTWCVANGVSLAASVVSLLVFIFVCLGLTRVVMETGVFSAKVTQMQPLKLMVPVVGTAAIGVHSLTMVSIIQYVFMYDLKTFLMPALMHGQRMAGRTRTDSRRLFACVALAVIVAVFVSYWASLSLVYQQGGQNLSRWFYQGGPTSPCTSVSSWARHPEPAHWGKMASCGLGAAFTGLLIFLRQQFVFWPLHPIGYILAFSFETTRVWFSFLVGWLVKVVVLRYGGGRLYRSVRFVFLGFILGELSAAGFWIVVDLATGMKGHVVFP